MMVYIYMNEKRNTEFLQRRHTGSTGKVMILILQLALQTYLQMLQEAIFSKITRISTLLRWQDSFWHFGHLGHIYVTKCIVNCCLQHPSNMVRELRCQLQMNELLNVQKSRRHYSLLINIFILSKDILDEILFKKK
jgi:hypothetical protein